MRAMLLAAGFGTRLQPLTRRRPKCLMPVGTRLLLDWWLERLAGWGVELAVVNTHHLAAKVRQRLAGAGGPEVAESHEPEILGTGGALVRARPRLGGEPFLLANADVVCDARLPELAAELAAAGAAAVLGVVDDARFNTVSVDLEGRVRGFGDPRPAGCRRRTYTGLAALDPALLDHLPPRGYSTLVQGLQAALAAGREVRAVELAGFWDDLGAPARLWALHRDLAAGLRPGLAGLAPPEPVWLASGAELAPGAGVEGFLYAHAGARVEAGGLAADSVLLPGAVVKAGARVRGAILGDGFAARGEVSGGAHA
jgi:mannose-1-phosphate guanylyltransferase